MHKHGLSYYTLEAKALFSSQQLVLPPRFATNMAAARIQRVSTAVWTTLSSAPNLSLCCQEVLLSRVHGSGTSS